MKKLFGLLTFIILGLNFGYGFSCSPIEAKNTTLYGQGAGSISWNSPQGSTKYCILSNGGNLNVTLLGQTVTLAKNEGLCVTKSDLPNGTNSFPLECLNSSCDLGWIFFGGDCNFMTSLECQSEYNLISPNDVQTEIKFVENEYESTSYYLGYNKSATINLNGGDFDPYQSNGNYTFDLILNGGGGSCNSGSISSGENWSALYINNLQFPGKSNIFVTIPDYIYWDYSSDDSDFNLYVGSGYDQDYIDNIVKINSYQPNSEDFTEIFVGGLTWIMPYIVIVLFIVFVRKLLKRIFR